jgi:methylated-DNA-protein-cysteine methyltransferase-like protein
MSDDDGSGDESFFARVYALVRRVPRGRVVTYGQVAAMLGEPRGARAVGWALRALPENLAARVPWHRVVGSGGRISPRWGPGPEIQRRRLRAERVVFRGLDVDMTRHGLESFTRPRRASDRAPSASEAKRSGFGRRRFVTTRPGPCEGSLRRY